MRFFEGSYWAVSYFVSSRFGTIIEFTSIPSSGQTFRVPARHADATVARLESGESPDSIAKSFLDD